MANRFHLLGLVTTSMLSAAVVAQTDHDEMDHDIHDDHDHAHGHVHHEDARHAPGAHDHAGHAHPGIDLTHPIVTESPLPETKLRFNYSFADGDEGTTSVFEVEAEYAFTQNFSIEAVVPYVFVNPEEGPSVDRLDNAILSFKYASYRWVDRNILPAIGLEVILPTGNEEKGIGSDHVVELEPFFRIGYWNGPFEVIGSVGIGLPFNQTSEEDEEEDFEVVYGVSVLYHVVPSLQALVELHGESVFGDEEENAFYVSPGVTFQPFTDKSINIGVGVSLPLTDDKEFDYAINFMSILHL